MVDQGPPPLGEGQVGQKISKKKFYCIVMSGKYHLRVSVDRKTGKKLAKDFVSKFEPVKYCFAYEEVDENVHIHGHLEYSAIPSKQTISYYMKQWNPDKKASFHYHKQLKKDEIHNMTYITKDGDILLTNYKPEELEKFKLENERIENEKSKPMKEQLVEHLSKKLLDSHTLGEIYEMIIDYHTERDYVPQLHLIPCYVIYVCKKLGRCKKQVSDYCQNKMF